ncbi:glycosyltransferase family 2 protein [uncultured Devosia sp.]|uniref:glycosyltransferase family 2 protein n=1 Tax=uncultured Devosia sp. TaxID=211434 RepID=UPI0035C9E9B8
MSDALDLIVAVSGTTGLGARQILEAALEREVDPLHYCAATLGLGQAIVMERAAAWAGFAFYEVVPRGLTGQAAPVRLEELANARVLAMRLLDRDVLFSAPNYLEILALAARLRQRPQLHHRLCFVPENALRDYLVRASATALIDGSRQSLARRWPFATAQLELTRPARISFVAGLILLFVLVLLEPFAGQLWLLPLTVLALVAPAALRMAAVWRWLRRTPPKPAPLRPDDAELPVYSVLIPLRDEAHMVPQLHAAMCALDYPPEKLDIKFVVEDRSQATLEAAGQWPQDPRFSLVAVPDAAPRTKPKALDYALPLCRGDHVVVFDAEDIPDPDQLWRAALAFRDAPDIHCLQAELVIENGGENWLTSLFAGEYAGLFGIQLPALAAWRLPLPLGGTSNHFRIQALRDLGGWDAFNVTEDADIGMRLARLRHRTAVLASRTREDAPIKLRVWMGQRTRWMKGWMQTFIVHNRNPRLLLRQMGLVPMLVFEVTVLSMIVSPLLHAALLALMLGQLALGIPLFAGAGAAWLTLHIAMLMLGYATALAVTIAGLCRQRRYRLLLAQLALPLYWLLAGMATLRALYQLIDRPFYWAKTEHRVSRTNPAVPKPQVFPVVEAAKAAQ